MDLEGKTDEEIIVHAQKENNLDHAFSFIYGKYQKQIYYNLLKKSKNPETAEDLTQEVFLKVHKYLKDYKHFEGKDFLHWLNKVTLTTYIDYYRSNKKKNIFVDCEEEYLERFLTTLKDDSNPEKKYFGEEFKQKVLVAIKKLDEKYSMVSRLRFFE